MGIEIFELAGMTRTTSAGRKVPTGALFVVPGVQLSDDETALSWPVRSREECRRVLPAGQMFQQFIRLWEKTPEEILAFARRWGWLHVDPAGRFVAGRTRKTEGGCWVEPIKTWVYFSHHANSLLTIAAKLRNGKRPDEKNWTATSRLDQHLDIWTLKSLERFPAELGILASRDLARIARCSLADQRLFLSLMIALWLKFTGLSLAFGEELEVDYNNLLLGAVALQLSLQVADSEGLYICSGCNKFYSRSKRSPGRGRLNFCDSCGRAASVQKADQRRRERVIKARQLHADGATTSEIAKTLGTSIKTAAKWIKKGK
jgi:transposase-like protein